MSRRITIDFRKHVCALLLAAVFAAPSFAQDLGCSSYVTANGGTIEVEANESADSTEDLQCAMQAAINGGYSEIFLVSDEYFISSVAAKNLVATIRGRSKRNTKVTVDDYSIACDGALNSALSFTNGNIALRNFTISVQSPCADPGDVSVVGIYSDDSKCSNRTAFANLDRLAITGAGTDSEDYVTAVTVVAAEGCSASNERILGTLKVNRSEITNLHFGVFTSLAGGGQVDINYNTFSEVGLPITIFNAQQSTTVLNNTINFNDASGFESDSGLGTVGVYIVSDKNSPGSNSTALKLNKFLDGGVSAYGVAISAGQLEKPVAHKLFISANTFTGNRNNIYGSGILAIDTRDGVISSNTFKSSAGAWIALSNGPAASGFLEGPVTGWGVLANNFTASSAKADIDLGSGTAGAVVVGSSGSPCVISQSNADNYLLDGSDCASGAASTRPAAAKPDADISRPDYSEIQKLYRLLLQVTQ